jgi:hypothetical protein
MSGYSSRPHPRTHHKYPVYSIGHVQGVEKDVEDVRDRGKMTNATIVSQQQSYLSTTSKNPQEENSSDDEDLPFVTGYGGNPRYSRDTGCKY